MSRAAWRRAARERVAELEAERDGALWSRSTARARELKAAHRGADRWAAWLDANDRGRSALLAEKLGTLVDDPRDGRGGR